MDRTAVIHDTIDRAAHTVLVVDDNPATRYSTGRVLRAAGFRIAEAGTGQEALDQCSRTRISAVVLDVHLPDIDGFEVCRRIRTDPATRLLPVVHLSAEFVRDEHHVEGLNAGADGYLVHPVEPSVLVATLQALIRARSAEDELRRSERRFRAIYDQAQTGIAVIDEQGRFADANPAMLQMLGRSLDEVLGMEVASVASPESHDAVRREFSRALQEPWAGEMTLVRPDGSPVHMQWNLSQQVGRGLRIATAADVSDKHDLEQRRRELLEREQAARAQAERHSRTKDDFIAVLSHELRTPLNAIIGWVHILKRRGVLPEGMRGLDAIERNVKTQARIISDILDVSRINSGKLQLERQTVDPAELVRDSLAALSATIDERRIRLETALEGAHQPAWLDPARYQQIVWNLVTNAVKFSAEGGEVRVTLVREGELLRLEVRDFGAGIKTDFLPHLFERFTQSDSPGNRRHGGLGLGLSIVKHLVDLHGGTVEALSDGPGTGTAMRVVLPVEEPAADAVQPARADEPETTGGPAAPELHDVDVLLVEDDGEAADMMRIVLSDQGAKVRVARDFDCAMQELAARRPDVLVSDIGLPGRDGYELARQVRAAHPGTRIPLIALTAFARPVDQQRSLEAGFDRHLPKPLKPHMLVGTIRELLPRRAAPNGSSHRA
jgi:PAS domain S-box-containing protein